MENDEAAQNQKKSNLNSDEPYQELTDLIKDAVKLDAEDQRRLKDIDNLSIGENEKIDWNSFSVMAMRGLLHGYDHGELSFEKMMKIAWNCSLPLKSSKLAFQAMGALAAIAVKIKPKERNAKPPPFPTWVKKAAVEYALLLEETNQNLKLSPNTDGDNRESVPSFTLKQIALFDLHLGENGKNLSEKTIYEWLCDHKRENDIPLQNRGPKRQ